tara:strand:- start:595 stop:699 length:105 start_codon:yes stop_codon:yes gene_type:complete
MDLKSIVVYLNKYLIAEINKINAMNARRTHIDPE